MISVDYRLGPYATYPAANEDAEDVLRAILHPNTTPGKILLESIRSHISKKLNRDEWVTIDTSRIAVSGFSSGGNIALGLAQSIKDDPTLRDSAHHHKGTPKDWPSQFPTSSNCTSPIPLLLYYPSLDSRLLPDERPLPPGLNPPDGFFTRLKIESELMPKYMPVHQRGHPRASPGLAPISALHPSAKIMLVLPELDSLSEQSMAWVQKMKEEGRGEDLQVVSVPGVMHGWTQFPDPWIKDEQEKAKKYMAFAAGREFVNKIWHGEAEEKVGRESEDTSGDTAADTSDHLVKKITRDDIEPEEARQVLQEQARVDSVLAENMPEVVAARATEHE